MMSKIEWNPRKQKHIEFLRCKITCLHNEIFHLALDVVRGELPREELEIKMDSRLFRRRMWINGIKEIKKTGDWK